MTALDFPTSPSNGDTYENYVYDGTKAVWRINPQTPGFNLESLSDTAITTPTDGQALVYDTATSKWVNESGLATETYVQENFGPKFLLETSEKTADYTLEIGDINKVIDMNKTGAATLTIPTNASVAFPTGTIIGVYNRSSDAVTIAGADGVTVRNAGDVNEFAEASLRKRGTDEWVMVGG